MNRPTGRATAPPADDIPPPPAPDFPDDSEPPPDPYVMTPEDEAEMIAESSQPVEKGDRRDPDEIAMQLLKSELGAKPFDG